MVKFEQMNWSQWTILQQIAVLLFMTSHSLSVADLCLPQQHIKGLSTFKRRGHLTDSAAQKKGTRAKGQGFLPARQQVGAALL